MLNKISKYENIIIISLTIILTTSILLLWFSFHNEKNNDKSTNNNIDAQTQEINNELILNDQEQEVYEALADIYTTLKKPSKLQLVDSFIFKTESGKLSGYIKVSVYNKIKYYNFLDKGLCEAYDNLKPSIDSFCESDNTDNNKVQKYFELHKNEIT